MDEEKITGHGITLVTCRDAQQARELMDAIWQAAKDRWSVFDIAEWVKQFGT